MNHIPGLGLYALTVTQSYTDWINRFYGPGPYPDHVTGPGDDPDYDGVVNLLEFALGLNPSQVDIDSLPKLTLESGQFVFRFTRPNYLTGITYTVQTSTDLITWTASATAPSIESSTSTADTLKLTLPTGATKLFAQYATGSPMPLKSVPVKWQVDAAGSP